MLNNLFVLLLRQSGAACLIVLALLPACALLRRAGAPRRLCCLLWAAVPLRLIFPALLRVPVSHTAAVPAGTAQAVQLADETMQALGQSAAEQPAEFPWITLLAAVWALGVLALLAGSLRRALALRQMVKSAKYDSAADCWRCPGKLPSAFVCGLLHPRIYLPCGLSAGQERAVLLHERAHLRCGDHWFKAVFWLAGCLHWFNPLVWLAFSRLARDLEAACDEAVLRELGEQNRADYCQSLLDLAGSPAQPGTAVFGTAFGGGSVKERIAHILAWKKPARLVTACGALACVALFGVCLARPVLAGEAAPQPSGSFATSDAQPTEAPAAPSADSAAALPQNDAAADSSAEIVFTMPAADSNAQPEQQSESADAQRAAAEAQAAKDAAQFQWPVPQYRYVSRWMGSGERSETADGSAVSGSYHLGSDLVAEKGAPVLAMADGTVAAAEYHDAYGYYVVLDHAGGYRTLYAHCDSLNVAAGDTVSQGQQIATVGATGNSTGDHCHVECFLNDVRFSLQAVFPNQA